MKGYWGGNMWIYMNDSFLSIIENDELHLTVRARRKEDIERVFPDASVVETPDRDYRYRAVMKRNDVAIVIAKRIMGIDYYNFKDSVKEYDRKHVYSEIWGETLKLQK